MDNYDMTFGDFYSEDWDLIFLVYRFTGDVSED